MPRTVSVSSFKPGCKSCTTRIPVTGGDMSFLVEIPSKKQTHLTPLLASWEENMLAFFWIFMSQDSEIGEFFSQEITSMRFFETNSHDQPWGLLKLKDQTYSAPELPDANESAKESYRYVSMSLAAQILSESISHKCFGTFSPYMWCQQHHKPACLILLKSILCDFVENEHD